MEPGRELDALVAEKVMGWDWFTIVGINVLLPPGHHRRNDGDWLRRPGKHGSEDDIESNRFYDSRQGGRTMPIVPSYSTDITAAWRVVELLVGRGFWFDVGTGIDSADETDEPRRNYGAYFNRTITARAATAPHAICLAALRAVGVEVD